MNTVCKKFLLPLILALSALTTARATHIVGGELEFVHASGNDYQVGLLMYFDAVNGNPAAIDPNVTVHIFRKSDNQLMESIFLPLVSNQLIPYTQPECASGDLVTRRIAYNRIVTFDPFLYDSPGGYYMVWERCCRNGTIDNIIAPGDAGQAFYLEFPPMIRNGSRFLNSSPRLFPPLSDYACAGQSFSFDFSGSDPDNDELTYNLSVPLNGFSSAAVPLPPATPAPYPEVNFVPGVGITNMIPGAPSLNISPDGVLQVTANNPGLYVFAVTCSEFRGGVKIGEVRREFQLMVLDCPTANEPEQQLEPNAITGIYPEGTVLELEANDDRCGILRISDIDPNTIISTEIIGINFDGGLVSLSPDGGTIDGPGELLLDICFPECPLPNGEPYEMDIVIGDNSCSIPLYDTLRVLVNVEILPNQKPTIEADLEEIEDGEECYKAEVIKGQSLSFDVIGDDIDIDSIRLSAEGRDFDMAALGMSFETQTGLPELISNFTWVTDCDDLLPGEEEKTYIVDFFVEDVRRCDSTLRDTICVELTIVDIPDSNNIPELTADLEFDEDGNYYFTDTAFVGDTITFDLEGIDEDLDSLLLEAIGRNFDIGNRNITLNPTRDVSPLNSTFTWITDCSDLVDPSDPEGEEFIIDFYLRDILPCDKEGGVDTIEVRIVLMPIPNDPPEITLEGLEFDETEGVYCDTVELGELIEFTLIGDDPNGHFISITGSPERFTFEELGAEFDSVSGFPILETDFSWLLDCSALDRFNFDEPFYFNFYVHDFVDCDLSLSDSLRVKIVIQAPDPNNAPPEVFADLEFDEERGIYVRNVVAEEVVEFDVTAEDPDFSFISLIGYGIGFELESLNMQFKDTVGQAPVTSPFFWPTDCSMLGANFSDTTYYVEFVATDFNDCNIIFSDTILVEFNLTVNPENTPPEIRADLDPALIDPVTGYYVLEIPVNDPITFDVFGDDLDGDELFMTASGLGFDMNAVGMEFPSVRGLPEVQSTFTWTPLCSFLNGAAEREFLVEFIVSDTTKCGLRASAPLFVLFRVQDNDEVVKFEPPNVFTPNDDGFNDTYRIPNLPKGSCDNPFKMIEIYNRWGKKVFSSDQIDFEWDGKGYPAGVYFYTIFYETQEFKGSVSIILNE